MAANPNLVSVREYLTSDYEVDYDYVDGVLEERNVGEWSHGKLILLIGAYLLARRKELGIDVSSDVRLKVAPTRYRVPDLAVIELGTAEPVLQKSPLLCIEILSPEDRLSRIRVRVQDYHEMGVPDAWIIDPLNKDCYQSTRAGDFFIAKDGVLTALEGRLRLRLADLE